jgi:DNA topoisomerase-1
MVHCIDPDCETNRERTTAGSCPKCGKDLRVIYSRAGKRFLGCSGYPNCTQTYPLPQFGKFAPTGDKCPDCGAPILQIWMRGQSWRSCTDMDCPSKGKDKKEGTKTKAAAKKKTTTKTAAKKATTAKKPAAKRSTTKKAVKPEAAATPQATE